MSITWEMAEAYFALLMCSDPTPVSEDENTLNVAMADELAKHFGFNGWVEAFHSDEPAEDDNPWVKWHPSGGIPRRGSLIEVRDGRKGWVTYNGLEGTGINFEEANEDVEPHALLRDPNDGYKGPYERVGEQWRYAEAN